MARTGKIARLTAALRNQLNRRLENGEPAKAILEWLNSESEVQHTIEWCFQGAPISEQNLSDWRKGGYQDWQRHQDACDILRDLDDEAQDFFVAGNENSVSELLAAKVAVEFTRVAQALLAEATEPKERWRVLQELLPHLARLRRADARASEVEAKYGGGEPEYIDPKREEAYHKYLDEQRAKAAAKSGNAPAAGVAGSAVADKNGEEAGSIKPNQGKSR